MKTVSAADGTKIAYDQRGGGPALILIDGAMNSRSSGPKPELATLLSRHFTVYSYDRRGRGDSGDTLPYAVDREVEDIEALIGDAGGTAYLFGHSSGACLALEATVKLGSKVTGLAMYDPPYDDDPAAGPGWRGTNKDHTTTRPDGRWGEAVGLFLRFGWGPGTAIACMH